MKIGIVGLPNVGKSTLFNAITQAGAESANYPFCTIEPNVGVVAVPDNRLGELASIFDSKKIIPTAIEFYDIAGLVKGASQGEGLGNKFLSHIREVAAIAHVIRCFESNEIVHVDGSVNPLRDIETINLELILADMEILERRLERSRRTAKGDRSLLTEIEIIEKVLQYLETGKSLRIMHLSKKELEVLQPFNLLSLKPVIYVANVAEEDLLNDGQNNSYVKLIKELAIKESAEVILISAQIEEEISQLDATEKIEFLDEMGLNSSGLDRLITAGYKILDLISFLTVGPMEARAWTIRNNTPAPQAAGRIHSDIERGFIRAEVVAFEDLVAAGNMANARDKGLLRIEGRDYLIQDGDVVHFRFNV